SRSNRPDIPEQTVPASASECLSLDSSAPRDDVSGELDQLLCQAVPVFDTGERRAQIEGVHLPAIHLFQPSTEDLLGGSSLPLRGGAPPYLVQQGFDRRLRSSRVLLLLGCGHRAP